MNSTSLLNNYSDILFPEERNTEDFKKRKYSCIANYFKWSLTYLADRNRENNRHFDSLGNNHISEDNMIREMAEDTGVPRRTLRSISLFKEIENSIIHAYANYRSVKGKYRYYVSLIIRVYLEGNHEFLNRIDSYSWSSYLSEYFENNQNLEYDSKEGHSINVQLEFILSRVDELCIMISLFKTPNVYWQKHFPLIAEDTSLFEQQYLEKSKRNAVLINRAYYGVIFIITAAYAVYLFFNSITWYTTIGFVLVIILAIICLVSKRIKRALIPNHIKEDLNSLEIYEQNMVIRSWKESYDLEISSWKDELSEIKRKRQEIEYWKNMNPYDFEFAVASVFEDAGFSTIVTPKSGDGGIDIEMFKNKKRILVQCKRLNSKISPSVVRDLTGVVSIQKAHLGIVVCLEFSSGTKSVAIESGILLINLQHLIELQNGGYFKSVLETHPSLL